MLTLRESVESVDGEIVGLRFFGLEFVPVSWLGWDILNLAWRILI